MNRDSWLTLILSLLLIGMCVVGYVYTTGYRALSGNKPITWAAPLIETGTDFSYFSSSMLGDAIKLEHGEENLFPCQVGELYLEKFASGEEALVHAYRIHGEDAPFERVFIPFYRGHGEKVTVWIFETSSNVAAKKHILKMRDRISESHEPDRLGSFFLQNVQISHLKDSNTYNYFYRKGDIIYWVSLATTDPLPLFLRFYEYF